MRKAFFVHVLLGSMAWTACSSFGEGTPAPEPPADASVATDAQGVDADGIDAGGDVAKDAPIAPDPSLAHDDGAGTRRSSSCRPAPTREPPAGAEPSPVAKRAG